MNKQEAIEKLQGMKQLVEEGDKGSYEKGLINALTYALNVTNQLDEPEKPVLTKEEAKWIKKLKARYISRENQLYIITRQGWGNDFCFSYYGEQVELPYEHWKGKEDIESVKRRLVDAIIYGHEVEKEKLYTAKLKSTGEYLRYDTDEDKVHHAFAFDSVVKRCENYHFTKDTLVKYNAWNNNAYDVNEVEE